MKKNIFYAQSGGVTAVINATAAGVIQTARRYRNSGSIGSVIAGRNGILGALNEDLVDTKYESTETIKALRYTPAGAFGTCRYRLRDPKEDDSEYRRLFDVFKAHNIGYFLYNGGGDSQDTTLKMSRMCAQYDHPLVCVGIPKTVDNDLPITDNCPGFGSVAKYVATSTREAALDVASMCKTSTKVFILEVMGRHAGWIAAAAGLSTTKAGEAPHIILMPEIAFNEKRYYARVKQCVAQCGYCVVVVSEGLRRPNGKFLSEADERDAFNHAQLGGVAPLLADMTKRALGYKIHWAVADYLQRSAGHIASKVDANQAYALGSAAVKLALGGTNAVMATVVRKTDKPYRWSIGHTPLSRVANKENKMPRNFITRDGFHITAPCRRYLAPLICGESRPPYKDGLPQYAQLKNKRVKPKLKKWKDGR